jgi:Ring finger domain
LTADNFSSSKNKTGSDRCLEIEEELDDVELGRKKEQKESGMISIDDALTDGEEETDKMMTIWDPHTASYRRQVEANCTICFADYEVGDVLIRSAADDENEYCNHVFHYECMLAWLEKGTSTSPVVPVVFFRYHITHSCIQSCIH